MIAAAISWILGNIAIPLFVIALIVSAFNIRNMRARGEPISIAYVVWGETLFYTVGVGFVYFWYFHAFRSAFSASAIGWQPSPFQWELAWAELGVAVIALLSLWQGYEMRLAATLVFAIFSFGAAAQHIHQIIALHNYAPGNAGLILWFGDIALPVILLILGAASLRAGRRLQRLHR